MSWLRDLFINEAKPALWRHSGGGGSDGPERFAFPTAAPGFYRHDTNFTELLCTWDECAENGVTIDGQHYEGYIYDYYTMFCVPADVIIPEGHKYDLMSPACGNVVIPSDVNSISLYEEEGVRLTTIYIKAITPPDYPSLSGCPNLKNIVVPKGCGDAYKMATNWCDYAEIIVEEGTIIDDTGGKSLAAKIIDRDPITEVTATDLQGVTKILMETFSISGIFGNYDSTGTYYYDTVEKITLPETVTEIASNGISYVSKLKNLTVLAKTPPTLGGFINGNASSAIFTIYVPAASVDLYKAATNWSNYDIRAIT